MFFCTGMCPHRYLVKYLNRDFLLHKNSITYSKQIAGCFCTAEKSAKVLKNQNQVSQPRGLSSSRVPMLSSWLLSSHSEIGRGRGKTFFNTSSQKTLPRNVVYLGVSPQNSLMSLFATCDPLANSLPEFRSFEEFLDHSSPLLSVLGQFGSENVDAI